MMKLHISMNVVMFLKNFLPHGEIQIMWLKKLKIAIVEQDIKKLQIVLEEIEPLETIDEMREALYLFREANELLYTLKDEAQASMIQLQKQKKFLISSSQDKNPYLNITT